MYPSVHIYFERLTLLAPLTIVITERISTAIQMRYSHAWKFRDTPSTKCQRHLAVSESVRRICIEDLLLSSNHVTASEQSLTSGGKRDRFQDSNNLKQSQPVLMLYSHNLRDQVMLMFSLYTCPSKSLQLLPRKTRLKMFVPDKYK